MSFSVMMLSRINTRRDEVGDHGREHQRQDDVVVAGQLEHEHDRGERAPRVAAPNVAAMATTANAPGETSSPGNRCVNAAPNRLP